MSFGIGLGSFVSGMQSGVRLGLGIREANDKRQKKNALKDITADTQAKYGDAMSDEAYDYMMRRQYAYHIEQGNVDKARQIKDWATKDTSRKGTKLFGSVAAALNAGDFESAANLANQLSDLDGYGPNGDYNFQYTQHPTQGAGFLVKTGGDDVFVPEAQALPFLTRHFNPEKAAAWQEESAKNSKALEKEAQTIRSNAIKALEKQYDGGLGGDEQRFRDMSDEQREELINKYAREQIAPGRRKKFEAYFPSAQSAAGNSKEKTAPGLIVDQNTGEKIKTPRAEAKEESKPGADGSIVRKDLPALDGSMSDVPSPSSGPGSTTKSPSSSSVDGNLKIGDAVRAAEDQMRTDGNAAAAAKTLTDAGVPERAWPRSIRRALQTNQPTGLSSGPSSRPVVRPQGSGIGIPQSKPGMR